MEKFSGYLNFVIACLFMLLFLYAAFSKLLEFSDFQTQLSQSHLTGAYAEYISYGVIIAEIGISLLLAFGITRRVGLYLAFLLMVIFTVYIYFSLNFTPFTPCSCGGVLESLGWTEHMVFNIVFIVLALVAIYVTSGTIPIRKMISSQFTLFIAGIGIVSILFSFSDYKTKHNNAFQRKYIPHRLEKVGSYDLPNNTFYIAGTDSQHIYLGNYNAPLYIYAVTRDLKNHREIKIQLDNYDLPYRRVKTSVIYPYFFLTDGSVPVIFRGLVDDWKAETFSRDAYFTHFTPVDSTGIAVTTTSAETKSRVMGLFRKEKDSVTVKLVPNILKKQIEGMFDTDGIILWNQELQEIVYVYFYRNQFEVSDGLLNFRYTGKTIDTISRAQIDVAQYQKGNQTKLGQSVMVNRNATAFGKHLYINSDRLGKYEDARALRSAGIIDQYNLNDNTYELSFYLYHQPDAKINEIKVESDIILAIVDNKLWINRIRPE